MTMLNPSQLNSKKVKHPILGSSGKHQFTMVKHPAIYAVLLNCILLTPSYGFSANQESPTASKVLKLNLPAGLQPQSVSLAANGNVKIHAQSQVSVDSEQTAVASCSNGDDGGYGGVQLGGNSETGDVISVGDVFLEDNATVNGTVQTAGEINHQNLWTITDSERNLQGTDLEPYVNVQLETPFPEYVVEQINIEPGENGIESTPGDYNQIVIKSRSSLILHSGVYSARQFYVEPQATVIIDDSEGPVILIVRDYFKFNGNVQSTQSNIPDWMLIYAGTNSVFLENKIDGTIFAPHADINIAGSGKEYVGNFLANNIVVYPSVHIAPPAVPNLSIWQKACELMAVESPAENDFCNQITRTDTELHVYGTSTLEPGESTDLYGILIDGDGNNGPDGTVVEVSSSAGTITPSSQTLEDGRFYLTYTAPETQQDIVISISAGGRTVEKTIRIKPGVLQYNSRGTSVGVLQEQLQGLGLMVDPVFTELGVPGYFDFTESAIKAVQCYERINELSDGTPEDEAIVVDGIYGPRTQDAIDGVNAIVDEILSSDSTLASWELGEFLGGIMRLQGEYDMGVDPCNREPYVDVGNDDNDDDDHNAPFTVVAGVRVVGAIGPLVGSISALGMVDSSLNIGIASVGSLGTDAFSDSVGVQDVGLIGISDARTFDDMKGETITCGLGMGVLIPDTPIMLYGSGECSRSWVKEPDHGDPYTSSTFMVGVGVGISSSPLDVSMSVTVDGTDVRFLGNLADEDLSERPEYSLFDSNSLNEVIHWYALSEMCRKIYPIAIANDLFGDDSTAEIGLPIAGLNDCVSINPERIIEDLQCSRLRF
jgi:hypothetical protein